MPEKTELSNLERQLRYHALHCIALDLFRREMISRTEYHQILSLLSQHYLKGPTETKRRCQKGGEM